MREIKFRAWEISMREIIPVNNIHFNKKMINTNGAWRLFDEIVLMQYTGLKDKNGVEIYEGDIVKVTDSKEKFRNIIEQIKFSRGSFDLDDTELCRLEDDYNSGKIFYEVIGNIYENPELLEGDNK